MHLVWSLATPPILMIFGGKKIWQRLVRELSFSEILNIAAHNVWSRLLLTEVIAKSSHQGTRKLDYYLELL